MTRYKAIISYDGHDFAGFQRQPHADDMVQGSDGRQGEEEAREADCLASRSARSPQGLAGIRVQFRPHKRDYPDNDKSHYGLLDDDTQRGVARDR